MIGAARAVSDVLMYQPDFVGIKRRSKRRNKRRHKN